MLFGKLLIFINSKNLRTIRKLIAYENFQDYSISKWKTGDCLVMQHRGDRLFLCFYYWRQPSPSLPFQVTKAAVGLPQYQWEFYLVSVDMKYTVQKKTRGFAWGPHWSSLEKRTEKYWFDSSLTWGRYGSRVIHGFLKASQLKWEASHHAITALRHDFALSHLAVC